MASAPSATPRTASLAALRRLSTRARRRVLRHRRLLAFVCAVLAVVTGLARLAPPPPATESVVIAQRPVAAGTVLSSADVREVRWPRGIPPEGSLRDLDQALGKTVGLPLGRGEPVTPTRLRRQSYAAAYPELVAVPVRFPDAAMVELLDVGDVIDVVATDPQHAQAQTVVREAPVLTIPSATNTSSTVVSETSRPGRLVVLGVPATSVENLAEHAVTDYLIPTFSR